MEELLKVSHADQSLVTKDISCLARSRDRMLSAVTGGENILFKVVDDTVCLILIHEQSLKRTRGL